MTAPEAVSRTDIAIVGGGMVGLSLALMLAELPNIQRIVLLEKRPLSVVLEQKQIGAGTATEK